MLHASRLDYKSSSSSPSSWLLFSTFADSLAIFSDTILVVIRMLLNPINEEDSFKLKYCETVGWMRMGASKSSSPENLYKQVEQGQAWRQRDAGGEQEEPSRKSTHPYHKWRGEQEKLLVVKTPPKQINGGFRRLKWVPSFPLFPRSIFISSFLLMCLTNRILSPQKSDLGDWSPKSDQRTQKSYSESGIGKLFLRRQRELNAYSVPLCWACVIYVKRHQGSQQPSPLGSMVNGPVPPSKASSETSSCHQRATAMERSVWLCFRLVSMAMGAPSSLPFSLREGQGYPREDSRNERKEKLW